ncbi:MAG: MlaD family protein [Candidatus Binatia bacterium]
MSKEISPTRVGAFVMGALALVVIGVIMFGSGRLFQKTYQFILYFSSSVNGLNVGAPVKAKGVEIGTVTNILLALDAETGVPMIPVIIEIDLDKLTSRGASSAALTDPAVFESLIHRGFRGQLAMQSLVTGLLYIDLDFHPGSPANFVQPAASRYKEIPTLPTAFEEAQSTVKKIMARLEKINFEPFMKSASTTVEGLNRLVNSPELKEAIRSLNTTMTDLQKLVKNLDAQIAPLATSMKNTSDAAHGALTNVQQAVRNIDDRVEALASSLQETSKSVRATMAQAKKSLSTVDSVIKDDSPVSQALANALRELSTAARSIRVLADYLERHPNALLYGKTETRDQ